MLIQLEPIFKERIWGGRNLEHFSQCVPPGQIGEMWCISGHEVGTTKVISGCFSGLTLHDVFCQHRELFADDESERFPLLIKILDAQQDLSIQIHPDDVYAKKHERSRGKTECWFVLEATSESKLVLGHHGNLQEAKQALLEQRWNDVLRYQTIQKGDFFFVPAGTIHAIGKGTIIYEVQQSSDITYRIYDYDRLENGVLRTLHCNQAVEVLKPFISHEIIPKKNINKLIDCDFFCLEQYEIGEVCTEIQNETYSLCSVFDGTLYINGEVFHHGDHVICTSDTKKMDVQGCGKLFVTKVKIKENEVSK